MTAIAALMILQRPALAGPTGGSVVAGSATISQTSTTTNVNQSTGKAIINWQGFSIGANETVNFNQPNSSSVTLNRVIGNETSVISGAINANGQVFIVNSAGVVFTRGAQVNVGGLVASTLDISNDNFLAGNYTFFGTSNAAIVNQGRIRAHSGGYVSLLGKTVSNDGVISARLGTVAMAAGQAITLNFGGNSLVDVTISQGALNALVANKRAIIADGGTVIMTAKAADQVLSAQVNNSGIIKAQTVAQLKGGTTTYKTGSIKLLADGGTTTVSGKLDASAPKGGDGGKIETSGDKVTIADSAVITTKAASGANGTWLIDPNGFTIAATGGDITGATLGNELANGTVIIASTSGHGTDGNLNVNDVVTWSANTTLTLNATNAININAVITGSGTSSGLALNAGTDININAPSSLQVATLTATAANNVNLNAAQTWANNGAWTFSGTNINVNDTVNWSNGTLTFNAGASGGFINVNAVMTASNNASFVATYNTGMDTSITSVYDPNIDATSTVASSTYGTPFGGFNFLFNNTSWTFTGRLDFTNITAAQPLSINTHQYALITNMTQLAAISGGTGHYALASDLNASGTTYSKAVISNLAGTLEGLGHAIDYLTINSTVSNVGLIGSSNVGSVVRDVNLANVSITGQVSYIGTLVGGNHGTIINANASGTLNTTARTGGNTGFWSASQYIGGLVGQNQGIIVGSQANVAVTTTDSVYVGGFVGDNLGFHLGQAIVLDSSSYGTVSVTITNQNAASFQINNDTGFGGFVGSNEGGIISNSSSSGSITAHSGSDVFISSVGGFVGDNDSYNAPGVINNSVSTTAVTGDANTSNVGGFVGMNNANFGGAFINNSSAFGLVQAPPANNVGGFGGGNYGTYSGNTFNPTTGQQIGSGVNYNGPDASATNATGPSPTQGPPPSTAAQTAATARSQAQSLTQQATTQQVGVAQQAAAEAAALAASQAAASQTGSVAAATAAQTASAPPSQSSSAAGQQAATDPASQAVGDNFNSIDTQVKSDDRRIHRRIAGPGPRGVHRGPGFGATIRSIDVDGQRFDLRNNNATPLSPAGTGR